MTIDACDPHYAIRASQSGIISEAREKRFGNRLQVTMRDRVHII